MHVTFLEIVVNIVDSHDAPAHSNGFKVTALQVFSPVDLKLIGNKDEIIH